MRGARVEYHCDWFSFVTEKGSWAWDPLLLSRAWWTTCWPQKSSEAYNESSKLGSCRWSAPFRGSGSWTLTTCGCPSTPKRNILRESHGGEYAGYFSGGKLYSAICNKWWLPTTYQDVMKFCKNCPYCAVVSGTGSMYLCSIQFQFNVLSRLLVWI